MPSNKAGGSNPYDFDRYYRSGKSTGAYTEEHWEWQRTLRRFIEAEITPYIEEWEEAETLPRELYKKAADIGLIGLGFPEEFGGTPVSDPYWNIITSEEFARTGAGGVFASLMIHGIGLPPVVALGSAELKARVVPEVLAGDKVHVLGITEPSGGSDVARLQTRAEDAGDHYVVNGSKTFITGGMQADFISLAVRTGGKGAGGISLLLVETDREGFSRTALKKQGWCCSDTATLYFDNVKVPKENLIGREGQGFLGIMLNFNYERLSLITTAVAMARVCLEDAIEWARERETFGKRLGDHQVIRHKIVEMARQITATQAWLDQCAQRVVDGETPVADLAMLKVQATMALEFCAREAMQILGGAGYMRGCRVERIYREVRVMAIGGGSEEIMRDLAARQMGI